MRPFLKTRAVEIPTDLVERYSRPGPRYTSYPTAPQFCESFGPDDFLRAATRPLRESDSLELSIYLHLPFCRSLCHYCGCHMMVTHRPEKITEYVGYLEREIDMTGCLLYGDRRVVQIHWGGGTPTFMAPGEIERLMGHLHRRFEIAVDAEISIEADPRGLTDAHLEAARRAGFNRISFGVQDFDANVQEAINRIQPEALVASATQKARDLGFSGINYDLIYGLPGQTLESFADTIRRTIALAPDRVSVFGYAHVPWKKKHQRLIASDTLPEPGKRIQMLLLATRMLTNEGGYRYIGMDHFARPDDTLAVARDSGTLQRNFQGYSTRAGGELYAFGISGISKLRGSYAQNVLDLRSYYQAVDSGRPPVARGYRWNRDDTIRHDVIMHLMCHFDIDMRRIEQRFGISFRDYFADALTKLDRMEEDGIVWISSNKIYVSELGRYFVRNIAMAFDAYLDRPEAREAPQYSQAV